jgi:hypothetical protein
MQRTPAFLCRDAMQIISDCASCCQGRRQRQRRRRRRGRCSRRCCGCLALAWRRGVRCDDCVGTKVELNNGSKQRTHLRKAVVPGGVPHRRDSREVSSCCEPNANPKKKSHTSSIHEAVSCFPQNFSSIKTKGSIQPVLKLRAHCASRITIDSMGFTIHEATLPDFFLPFE